MLMTYIWLGMICAAVLWGAGAGTLDTVSAAVTNGAQSAVTLCVSSAIRAAASLALADPEKSLITLSYRSFAPFTSPLRRVASA